MREIKLNGEKKVGNMRNIFNFNAGPSMLPEEVLLQAQAEMLDWHGTGMSIMEIGHRSAEFGALAQQTEADLRELMGIPSHYHVFFLPGGATAQFAMVPLNLFAKKRTADYVDTGIWSKKAIEEAKHYGSVRVVAQVERQNHLATVPSQNQWDLNPDAAYLHYTPNETIDGIEFNWVPQAGNVPLVADMSSMILSRPIDVAQYGIIYAGAQKNMGQAGITIVIIKDDLIQEALPHTPTLYRYKLHAEHHSFYNTPPTYSWYMTSLVLAWMKRHGGVPAFYERNQRKAGKLYAYLDKHADFYRCPIHPHYRSLMNVVFTLCDETLTSAFLKEATQVGLANLKGHRVAGGVRASIYNAMPEEGVDALLQFMDEFALNHTRT
jgi:phosphoserine aminotransferase